MTIKSIRNAKSLTGKKVLLRADFNVSIKAGRIKDDYKIVATLPTIRFLLRHKARIIIMTHLDVNKSLPEKNKLSTKLIAVRLSRLLGKKVNYLGACLGPEVSRAVARMEPGEIVLLENLRSCQEEVANDKKFAKALAGLADIYVNDGFAVSHRNHASLNAIKKYIDAYAGLLLEKEVINLHKILRPAQPLIAIIGGSKMATKIRLIKNLAKRSSKILIGGALANNFIAAHGFKIGKSLADQSSISLARALVKKYKNIILPVDVIVASKALRPNAIVKEVNRVDKNDIILDIGPKTIRLYSHFLNQAATIIWNGPVGKFEEPAFKHGTSAVARIIAARATGPAFAAVGGKETIEALKMVKMIDYIDWVSTGGGAMLAYLGGEKMPGLKGIVK
ncbi:MAG: phosphoglycerate kinase [Parcubacteria group bacterium]|nr:phosphoglycerate kinase [Parcubacteria group bacterium]